MILQGMEQSKILILRSWSIHPGPRGGDLQPQHHQLEGYDVLVGETPTTHQAIALEAMVLSPSQPASSHKSP